ncbi:MAG: glycoside hydrolase family 9 protein [Bacteroidaceae bacterium]|nr:glycoside hydrolase family 9 protein [Bacteroidaceae bacterium]
MTVACCVLGASAQPTSRVRMNQVGFYPQQEKVAVIASETPVSYKVLDAKGKRVLKGVAADGTAEPWKPRMWQRADLSALTAPGAYTLCVGKERIPFEIRERALSDLARSAARAFYLQRMGVDLEERYAGKYARPAAHLDDSVLIHPSAAGPVRRAGSVIQSPYGWYDAGDYNKYIVNSGYSIGLMLSVYRLIPDYFARQNLGIPESDNQTPDLLDEIFFNLQWMMTMQDPTDGGVYHKLTTPSFEAFVMPTECRQPRYVVMKTTAATLDFAACMADASVAFRPYEADYPGAADLMLGMARKAYEWAVKHPDVSYRQQEMNNRFDPDITTGAYDDASFRDEWFWASVALRRATRGDNRYMSGVHDHFEAKFQPSSWGSVAALGMVQLAFAVQGPSSPNETERCVQIKNQSKELLLEWCDRYVERAQRNAFLCPYGLTRDEYLWGSNSESNAVCGVVLLYAYKLTGDARYLQAAQRNAEYLLGRNTLDYCFVTGYGRRSPQHPHQRLSEADGIEAPLPGFLVGGPNIGQQDRAEVTYPEGLAPNESYRDVMQSYATNEIAINWNASLVGLMSALDAFAQ